MPQHQLNLGHTESFCNTTMMLMMIWRPDLFDLLGEVVEWAGRYGDVERGLGRHAKFRDAHVGSPDSDGAAGSSGAELCLEIRIDGPQEQAELFTRSDDGTLLLTDFSRQLATAWLYKLGRRYSCQQKARKDFWQAQNRLAPQGVHESCDETPAHSRRRPC